VIKDKACFVRAGAIIYGTNNIVDLPTTEDRDLQELSTSVAAMVSSKRLFVNRYNDDKKDEYLFHGDSLAHSYRMCDEDLNSQHAGAKCSSFLVGEDIMVTAAHCLIDVGDKKKSPEEVCKSHNFIFDFNDSKFQSDNHHGAIVKKKDVYSCAKVIEYKNDNEHDYAVIKLDRIVEGRSPVKLLNPSEMTYGSAISTLGFPQGLTLRASTDGKFYELSKNRNWLLTQVDSFSGNSGGPIIDELTNMVVGIHTHGLNDALIYDSERSCYTYSSRCSDPTTCGTGYAFNITKIETLKNKIVQNTNLQREELGCE
jgi:V8-like Glu-specific endopeptidase